MLIRDAEFRRTTGYTENQVCDILNWGRGKVGRFEASQWKRPQASDIRDLVRRHLLMIDIFGFPGDEPPLVFEETDYSVAEAGPGSVTGCIQSFERARAAALDLGETTVYLGKLAERLDLTK